MLSQAHLGGKHAISDFNSLPDQQVAPPLLLSLALEVSFRECNMEPIVPETREFPAAVTACDNRTHRQSWECAVLWGSLVLEASSGQPSRHRLPDAVFPTTWNSTTLCVLCDKDARQPATVVPRWIN